MSLRMGERRKLRRVARDIARTDPHLAALYSMFARLSGPESMPRTERVRAGVIRRKPRVKRRTPLRTAR